MDADLAPIHPRLVLLERQLFCAFTSLLSCTHVNNGWKKKKKKKEKKEKERETTISIDTTTSCSSAVLCGSARMEEEGG